MTALYTSQTDDASLFAEADALYGAIKQSLTSPEFEDKTASEVERWLSVEQHVLSEKG